MARKLQNILPGVGRDYKVAHDEISGGFSKFTVANGQDETMNADITVTGISSGDEIVGVLVFNTGVPSKRPASDFSVSAADTITVGANAADNTGNVYVIFWNDLTT